MCNREILIPRRNCLRTIQDIVFLYCTTCGFAKHTIALHIDIPILSQLSGALQAWKWSKQSLLSVGYKLVHSDKFEKLLKVHYCLH